MFMIRVQNFGTLPIPYIGSNVHLLLTQIVLLKKPITVAARSKVRNVFERSKAGIVGSNPTQGMDFRLRLFCVYVGSGLETVWSLIQKVLPTSR
jgi:hypothetical protein